MKRNRNSDRGRVAAIAALGVALAVLGTGCRDDGNDRFGADETTDTIEAGDASDVSDGSDATDAAPDSSTADEPGDTPRNDTEATTATAAPDATAASSTTVVPADTDSTTDTDNGAPDATDAPPPTDEPGDTQPPTEPPPDTQPPTAPPTTTVPVDTGTRAFCDAMVAAEMTYNRGPEVDFETATAEEIAAAVAAYEATLERLLDESIATAPGGIRPDVETAVGFLRASIESGEDLASEPDYRAADERVDLFVAGSCGYAQIAVSAVDYSFANLPSSLPTGRTTFAFTNNGAELHEMVVFRVNDGVTETLEELLELPDDEVFTKVLFIGATFGIQGETDTETFELTPGRYVALCFVPIGTTDPEFGADEPGEPHFTAGMQAEFTVA